MGDPSGSHPVMADAQFGVTKIFKPFEGFEAVYQGRPTTTPIAIPGTRDASVSKSGFDPNLLKGIPVPLGARVSLWVPLAVFVDQVPTTFIQIYQYRISWRLRNIKDFRDPADPSIRTPYHFPIQRPQADGLFVLPGAANEIAFEQAEPVGANAEGVLNVRTEVFNVRNNGLVEPLLPDGVPGVWQQGVLPAAVGAGLSGDPIFCPFWFDAKGDEMMITVTRTDPQNPVNTWDFTDPSADLPFSNMYGTGNGMHPLFPAVGVYVMTGTNP